MRFGKRVHRVLMHYEGPGGGSDTIEGLLLGASSGHYVLRTAMLKQDAETTLELDGEVRIPKGRVMFFQVLQ